MRMRAAHRIVVASIIGVVAASIQMTPAVARALPTPDSGRAPRARTPWLAPANLHPYRPAHHAQRHRREAPAVPDRTLLSDPLVLAWKHRSISRQEFVRYGLLNVVHRSKVPARFRTRQLTAGQSLAYYSYVMQQAKGLPAGQRAQLQSLSTPTLRRRTAASPQDVVSECAATASVFLYDFTCQHYTAHFAIFYNLKVVRDDGFIQSQGLPDADADGNGLPDALDELAEAFEKSYDVYTSMGYKIDQDNGRNLVLVGVDDGGQGTGAAITLPTGLLATGGAPFVMLPSDPGATNYSYLPRHELFHAFQYHYLNLDHLLLNLASLNWWMESTAEWAAHVSFLNDPDVAAKYPGNATRYADELPDFLADPARALNAWDGLGKPRQYGAFVFPLFVAEYVGDDDAILHTWERMGDGLPLDVITNVMADYGVAMDDAVSSFWVASYLSLDAFWDQDAQTTWRAALDRDPRTQGATKGTGRPARSAADLTTIRTAEGEASIGPGGAVYVDLAVPSDSAGGHAPRTLTIDVTTTARVKYTLLQWGAGSYPDDLAQEPLRYAGPTTVTLDPAATSATLVISRVDLHADNLTLPDDVPPPLHWSVGLDVAHRYVLGWGDGRYGQLGTGRFASSATPVAVKGLTDVVSVSAGGGDTFAIDSHGNASAWGANGDSCLQVGHAGYQTVPAPVIGLDHLKSIIPPLQGCQYSKALALKDDGTVWSWGIPTGNSAGPPEQVPGLDHVVQIASDGGAYLALLSDGTVKVWGTNLFSQLGPAAGSTYYTDTPIPVPGLASVSRIAMPFGICYALLADGTVWAWGSAGNDLFGAPVTDGVYKRPTPQPVSGVSGAVDIAAQGSFNAGALLADGTVVTWGPNDQGSLGRGLPDLSDNNVLVYGGDAYTPGVAAGLPPVAQLSVAASQAGARTSDGRVFMWGYGTRNGIIDGLGVDIQGDSTVPVEVTGVRNAIQLAVAPGNGFAVVDKPH